jgi:putative membrane protein
MTLIANIAALLVAVLHLCFLVLEMFLWTKPMGRRVFRTTPEFAQASASLAANQGLYNGFLAAGLFWGVSLGPRGYAITLFSELGLVIGSDPNHRAGLAASSQPLSGARSSRLQLATCQRQLAAAGSRGLAADSYSDRSAVLGSARAARAAGTALAASATSSSTPPTST